MLIARYRRTSYHSIAKLFFNGRIFAHLMQLATRLIFRLQCRDTPLRAACPSYAYPVGLLARFINNKVPTSPKPIRSAAAAGDVSKPSAQKPPKHPSPISRQPIAGHPNNSATRTPATKLSQPHQQPPIQPRKYGEPLPTDPIPDLPPPSPFMGTPSTANSTTGDQTYPPQLLIYDAGKLPLVLVTGMKLTTLFFSIFVVFLYAPQVYFVPEYSNWTLVPGKVAQ